MGDGEADEMLQMNCPNCDAVIKSSHLAEVQLFLCPQCKEIVVVKDVVISTPPKSLKLRPSLKKLLSSAREKFQRNKSDNLDLQTKYVIDRRLARFSRRDDFRLSLSHDFFVQLKFGSNKRPARLLNISSTGAAIEFFELDQLPEKDSEIIFHLLLPGQAEALTLLARGVWSGKLEKDTVSPTITMGLQFKDINEATRSYIWEFIVNAETSS
jgi:hypothetical protein